MNAADPVMTGTYFCNQCWTAVRLPVLSPATSRPTQPVSWPSLQRLGVTKLNAGVVATFATSRVSAVSGARCFVHSAGWSVIAWK